MFCIQFGEQLTDFLSRHLIVFLLHIGKGQADDRISSLNLSVVLILPDGKPLEQISPVLVIHGEKLLHHAHVQRLAETARAGNQCHAVSVFPPFLNEVCFINIKIVSFYKLIILLYSDCYISCHRNLHSLKTAIPGFLTLV